MYKKLSLTFLILFASVCLLSAQVLPSARQDPLIESQALLKDLKQQKANLDKREAEVKAREEQLKILENTLLTRETDLKAMREEVMKRIDELGGKQDAEVDKLVKMFAATKPKAAAKIFSTMDLVTSIEVFRRMPPTISGKIMNELGKLNPEYASKLTEGLKPVPYGEKIEPR